MNVIPINAKDVYKVDHKSQYPANTQTVGSNATPRTLKYSTTVPGIKDHIVVFGLQYFIKWFLMQEFQTGFFDKPKAEVVGRYRRRIEGVLGKGAINFDHVEALHDLGYMPVIIRAIPEGSIIDPGTPAMLIHNTHEDFYWVTNFLETIVSCMTWSSATSASTANKYRMLAEMWCERTGGIKELLQWQCHDFSFRGMPGIQAASMSGAGHLLSFTGTDTIPAIDFLEDWYNADCEKELIGGSVPATEHSVMCLGEKDNEYCTFERLIKEIYTEGVVSIVSDTWDFWEVVTDFLPRLKETIMNRKGKVVIRPDSGNPTHIICGTAYPVRENAEGELCEEDMQTAWEEADDKNAFVIFDVAQSRYLEITEYKAEPVREDKNIWKTSWAAYLISDPTPEQKGTIQCLWETFGGTTDKDGFRQLHETIGLIYGEQIQLVRANDIWMRLSRLKFASTNVLFGIGSFEYTYKTRDSQGWAVKATWGKVNGEFREIFKDPKTDGGMKKSAKGRLVVQMQPDGSYTYKDQASEDEFENNNIPLVYENGKLLVDHTLQEVRDRLAESRKRYFV